jgi:signal transduction histidine kinase
MDATSFALIVHDLKNALGGLEGDLAALAEAPTPTGARQAHVRCAELRRQFVQFLTLYGGNASLKALCEDESPIELLSAIARSARQGDQPGPEVPAITLAPDMQPPAFWYFDRRLVQLALDAAVHNALRYARRHVVLRAREEAGQLVMVVDDDGAGLGATTPAPHSTGLGTDLCRAVADAHHCGDQRGRIHFTTSPMGGCRFELWLP